MAARVVGQLQLSKRDKKNNTSRRDANADMNDGYKEPCYEKGQLQLSVASLAGPGAVLAQVEPDGRDRPVSCASRAITPAEKKYAQIQKEATAIIFGIRRFHQFLYGKSQPFVFRADHKPLISMFGPNKSVPEVSANRLQRYAIFLSAYNYLIEYVRSIENNADFFIASGVTERAGAGG